MYVTLIKDVLALVNIGLMIAALVIFWNVEGYVLWKSLGG